jgi:hypothetical protein
MLGRYIAILQILLVTSCNNVEEHPQVSLSGEDAKKRTYGSDMAFLKKYTRKIVELSGNDGRSKVLLSADYQGRVMTSTASGDTGLSFGWLNYALISSGKKRKSFNPVGGEERFWLGPEGGQYSIYFKKGDSFTINNWQVPYIIDTVTFDVVESSKNKAVFKSQASLTNYSGTKFDLAVERRIAILDKDDAAKKLNINIPENIGFVGYETENRLQNIGKADWTREKGLVSIWLLGMFTPTPETVVIIPFRPGDSSRSHITDNYFGVMPKDRLQITDSILFFVCDGKYRSKIGLSPVIAKALAAGYDFRHNVLTLVIPEIHPDAAYVNSKWEWQKEPYKGDVVNSYNDGPLEDGTQMGPFYEIESSSPALALKQGQSGTYVQATLHLQGDYPSMRQLATALLGVDLDKIKR